MVDDQSKTSTAEILRKLKANHEAWVRTSLCRREGHASTQAPASEKIPSPLLRLTSGREVLKIVDRADGFQARSSRTQLSGGGSTPRGLLQEAQDCGDLSGDLEAGDRVQAAFRIRELVPELEKADSGSSAGGDSSSRGRH